MTSKRTILARHRCLAWAAFMVVPAMLGAKGCDIAVVGSECGGLQGAACGEGQFCDFAPDAFCGAADQTGTCQEIPDFCTREFNPVCGCDGETYSNACEANAAGVSVASQGACEGDGGGECGGLQGLGCGEGEFCDFAPDAACGAADQTGTCEPIPEVCTLELNPVCGCDDQTYGNACEANLRGVSVAHQGACERGGQGECGGLLGLACGEGEFCNFAPDAFCGAADQTGTCEVVPEVCDALFAPVCGCDGVTYSNACEANRAGTSVASDGECSDGGDACGGLQGLSCGDGEFCNFPLDASCGAADQTGTCETIPDACTLELNPVCGCDDETYGNACLANAGGVAVAHEGACERDGGAACGGLLGLPCGEGEFCDFAPDAFCGAADQTGTCRTIPEVCTFEFDPMCGCDGETYDNACAASAAGVSVASPGECP